MKKSSHRSIVRAIRYNSGGATVGAGITSYLYCATQTADDGASATEDPIAMVVITRSGIIRNLVVAASVAAGAGETFTYTIRVNKAASALTCTIGGAVDIRGQDLVNEVEVSAGDVISLQIVNSAGGAVATHAGSFELESM